MALADFKPDTVTVALKPSLGDKSPTVELKGLSFHDFSKLIRVHYHDLDGLFDIYENSAGQDLSAIAVGRFATTLIADAPGLVSHIIALAAGEEDQLEAVQSLPLIVQIDALKAIGGLTFSDVEEVKKMLALVMEQLGKLNPKQGPNGK